MADIEEIIEEPRTGGDDGLGHENGRGSTRRKSSKRKGKRRSSGGSEGLAQASSTDQGSQDGQEEDKGGGQSIRQPADSPIQRVMPTQGDHRARFYEDYHKVAEEYDKEFLKKHDEDLNTTLIFAGLFSAVTSAFIIQVDSQLQPDPNDETAALLRVLIYKIDNTTFGDNVPTLPQWSGPPHTMVQVQAILFASLAVSLLSAFLAMLGKQWLNRYESTDLRGSAIERSHDRQRKLGGIVGWYFNNVMESLPLMLQAGLLLLGLALSLYLWQVDITVASVVVGVTSLGLIFYIFIVVAGTASESCPYQTPAAHVFRHTLHYLRLNLLPALRYTPTAISTFVSSSLSRIDNASWLLDSLLTWWVAMRRPWYSMNNLKATLLLVLVQSVAIPHDAYYLARATVQPLVTISRMLYHQLMGKYRTAFHWFTNISLQTLSSGQQAIMMDLRCISWILQTSLDKVVHVSAFKLLTSMPDLAHLHPALVVDCFNILIGSISVGNSNVEIAQGSEQLAEVSADGFLHTLRHLLTTDPASSVLVHLQRRYNEVFPSEVDFTGLPFHSVMTNIHALVGRFGNPRDIQWDNCGLSVHEHIPFAEKMAEIAQERYQSPRRKVPRSILRSALYLLSLGPQSPASIVANCLTIIAIDLGCDLSNITTFDHSARVDHVSNLVTKELETMFRAANSDLILSKRKAINALLPYAIFLEQGGEQRMIDAISRAARVSSSNSRNLGTFVWRHVLLYISRLFEQQSPTSLNRVIALMSPLVPWDGALNKKIAVTRWAEATLAISYTEEVGQSVVVALFQIASIHLLRPHIPVSMWGWLKRRPSLPRTFNGQLNIHHAALIAYLRRLGDVDILKSYFLLVWTVRDSFHPNHIRVMEDSIREVFNGTGMEHHRKDLIEQLDRALEQSNPLHGSPPVRELKAQYTRLRGLLLEVGG